MLMTEESERFVKPFNVMATPNREESPTNIATNMSRESFKDVRLQISKKNIALCKQNIDNRLSTTQRLQTATSRNRLNKIVINLESTIHKVDNGSPLPHKTP